MKDNYIFPAVFHVDEEGVSVCFPDLPGCLTCADTMEEDGEAIPMPSKASALRHAEGQSIAMIDAWMPPFREKMSNKATSKTVTIPRWLDILARREKVNYSHLLQSALKSYLGVTENPSQSMRA